MIDQVQPSPRTLDDAVDLSAIAAEETVRSIDSAINTLLDLDSVCTAVMRDRAKYDTAHRQFMEKRAYIRALVRSLAGLQGSEDSEQ